MTEGAAASTGLTAKYRKRGGKSIKLAIVGVCVAALIAAGGIALVALKNSDTKSDTLSVGLLLEPTNLNIRETGGVALDQVLLDNVYQGLITLQPGTVDTYRPALATALPQVSDDRKTYTFKLRDGVRFHDGAEFDAGDAVESLTATIGQTPGVTVSAPDSLTVQIQLQQPDSQLLWRLAGRDGIILDSDAANNLANSANGTGPFKLAQWQQGDSIRLEANTAYWGEAPQLSAVTFKFIPDPRAAVNALKDGSLDVHTAVLPSLRDEFSDSSDFKMFRAASTDVFTLAFNSARGPLTDTRFRRALSQAIDTSAIIASQNGDGKPLGSPITELEPGYTDLTGVNAYDPAAARETIAELGLTGTKLTLTVPNFYDQAPIDIIVSQLAEVGVTVEANFVEFSTWLERVYTQHDYDLSYVDHAEPLDFVNYTNPDYYFGYTNSEVAALYNRYLAAGSPQEQQQALSEAAALVAADAPAKWVFNYTPTVVAAARVTGFPEANTNSRINLDSVAIER